VPSPAADRRAAATVVASRRAGGAAATIGAAVANGGSRAGTPGAATTHRPVGATVTRRPKRIVQGAAALRRP